MTNQELFERLQAGDKSVRDEIIVKNVGLVHHVVNRYKDFKNPACDFEDLVSHGMIALIRAVDTFDPGKKASFSTYAITCIHNRLLYIFRGIGRKPFNYSLDGEVLFESKVHGKYKARLCDAIEDKRQRFEKAFEIKDIASRAVKHFDDLSARDREVMILNVENYQCSDQRKLAKRLGISQPTFCRRLQHARMRMTEIMTENGEL